MHPITAYLLEHEVIDDEDVCYNHGNKFPFTKDQFRAWYKEHMQEDKEVTVRETMFPTVKMPLIADGHEFVLSIMWGQGSAVTVFTKKRWREIRKREIADYREKYGKKKKA